MEGKNAFRYNTYDVSNVRYLDQGSTKKTVVDVSIRQLSLVATAVEGLSVYRQEK